MWWPAGFGNPLIQGKFLQQNYCFKQDCNNIHCRDKCSFQLTTLWKSESSLTNLYIHFQTLERGVLFFYCSLSIGNSGSPLNLFLTHSLKSVFYWNISWIATFTQKVNIFFEILWRILLIWNNSLFKIWIGPL